MGSLADVLDELVAAGVTDGTDPESLDLLRYYIEDLELAVPEIVAAHERGELVELGADVLMVHDVSLAQLGERFGLDRARMEELWVALGLPVDAWAEPTMSTEDLEDLAIFHVLVQVLEWDQLLDVCRVTGASLMRIAEAIVTQAALLENDLAAKGATPAMLARFAHDDGQLLQDAGRSLTPLLRRHTEAALKRNRISRRRMVDPLTSDLAVGFVDLAGYTSLSGTLSRTELWELVRRFEAEATDVVNRQGGQVAKLIGDEVMFTVWSVDDGLAIAAALLERLGGASGQQQAHGGLAYGPVVAHQGDVFGPVVNLAARAASVAVPGEVLVSAEAVALHTSVPAGFRLEPAGRRAVRGFPDPIAVHALVPDATPGP